MNVSIHNKSLSISHSLKESSENFEQPLEASIIACLNILFSYSRYSLQDKMEKMETSRKICLVALSKSMGQMPQNNKEKVL